jgi:branched-chain amino acid transport system substrate-binding protein
MGYERMKNFDLQGFLPPMTVTEADHEGGGWIRLYQVKGKEWVPATDWFRGYREVILAQVKKVNDAHKAK